MHIGSRVAILLALALAAACASGTAGTGRPRRDQATILPDELGRNPGTDLLGTIQSLRPLWLHKRGPISINSEGDILVYVDNMRFGTVPSLRAIDVSTVEWLQFLSAAQAQARFGVGHPHGAILVFTKRGQLRRDSLPDESRSGERRGARRQPGAAASHASAARAIAGGTVWPPSNSSYRTS